MPEPIRLTAHLPRDDEPTATRCGAAWEPWQDPTAETPPSLEERRRPGERFAQCAACFPQAEEPTP